MPIYGFKELKERLQMQQLQSQQHQARVEVQEHSFARLSNIGYISYIAVQCFVIGFKQA